MIISKLSLIHLKNIFKKSNQKLNAFIRITKFTSTFQRKTLLNFFKKSKFSYCHLAWIFSSKGRNKKIDRTHEKSLKLVLNDHQSPLDETSDTLNEKTIYQQCIDRLTSEFYKFLNGCCPDTMNDVFQMQQNTYNLQNFSNFATDVPKNNYLLNHIVYRENQLWETLTFEFKNSRLLEVFKDGLKNWRCTKFPCHICSRFLACVGYIQ